ncbi:uncharacterized protein LOC123988531 [Osmia bicornis bicornis]|uniref:uncharacterized protein LOC123988531 n=1 Tax=Osmia bicornis bicornis TaxID=1437191 RepID=UPI001EAF11C9|nr:uncharacterized protein LOC123988531 [Osmia bicornis bicornis]
MFNIARITGDDTKYHHIIAQLDQSVLPFVADLLTSPPARGKYDAIKERLINSFDESAEAKLRRVLRSSHLGDEKPSHYLQKLRNLAGNQISEVVLRSLFLEQLPENIRSILVISDTSLANLALQADKIQEMHSVTIAAASRTSSSAPLHRDGGGSTSTMQNQIDRLAKMVEALTVHQSRQAEQQPRSSWQRRSRSRVERSPQRPRSREGRSDLCFYHRRFAERAHRCVIPCGWTGTPPVGPPTSSNHLQGN